jgi:hypothetical protein
MDDLTRARTLKAMRRAGWRVDTAGLVWDEKGQPVGPLEVEVEELAVFFGAVPRGWPAREERTV